VPAADPNPHPDPASLSGWAGAVGLSSWAGAAGL